jgi:ABC-type bacteriocin/lantibiotic exporter with double-glycine peptidase domain
LLDKTGRHTSYEELKKDFERQRPPDSLLAIREVLKEHGCTTKGVRTSAEFFLNNGGPSIVYLKLKTGYALNEGHFALLVNAGRQTGVKLLDPVFETNGGSLISWDSFSRIYQGSALVLE